MKKIKSTNQFPPISVVVIGLNVTPFLSSCLTAIKKSDYPQDKLELIYVDSGSTDGSHEIAQKSNRVKLIELNSKSPSAAKGRNAGFKAARYDLIQFVDADSYLHPKWLKTAVEALDDEVAAVAGSLRERNPERNIFHRMANLEWNLRVGPNGWTTTRSEAKTFGGNVMIQRASLKVLQGYDETLVAGEDPDLSYRLRKTGKKILRLNTEMASHDINIDGLSKFLKRSRRSGFAYTQLAWRYLGTPERFMLNRVMRIVFSALTPLTFIVVGILNNQVSMGLLLGLLFAFRLVFKTGKFSRMFNISKKLALGYSLYLTLAIYPQFAGLLQALWQIYSKQLFTKKTGSQRHLVTKQQKRSLWSFKSSDLRGTKSL